MINVKVLYARHAWHIEPNYEMKFTRPELGRIYRTHVIVHYYNPAKLVINGQTHQIEKDCVFFLRKGDYVSVSYCEDSFIDYIHVMGNMGGFLGKFGLKFNTPYYPKTTSFCTSITKKLEEELYSLSPYTNDICCENVAYFISLLARYLNPEYEKSFDNKSLKELRTEMKNHPEYNWTGEKMAQFVGMGETAFYESYFKMFKKSPKKDLILIRCDAAKILLAQSKYSVSEVSKMLGYTTPDYFIRQFKSVTGQTPKQYMLGK